MKKQLKEQWISLVLALFTIVLMMLYRINDNDLYSKPFFKYDYDNINQIIKLESSDNINPTLVNWIVPSLDEKTTTYSKSGLRVDDVAQSIIIGQDWNPLDKNLIGYVRCSILNSFGLNEKTTDVVGFPVGVEVTYILKGEKQTQRSYNIVLLRDFSMGFVQIHLLPNIIDEEEMKFYLLENGSNKINEIIKNNPYDHKNQYLESDGSCNLKSWTVFNTPLR